MKKRKIAILTDCHSLLEPLEATLADIKKRGIEEIYSLGDNIGNGPNPKEVLDLLMKNRVLSVAGNAEYYITLGMAPFASYFDIDKLESELWTISKLEPKHLDYLKSLPASIELELGGEKISLCHFAGDVRTDWLNHGQSRYQNLLANARPGYPLFEYTNSQSQLAYLNKMLELYGTSAYSNAITSQLEDPLFKGESPSKYDAIIQGHTHFEFREKSKATEYYTIRANGMGYKDDPPNSASYVILTELDRGFDIEKILVPFDHQKMINAIAKSDIPNKTIIEKYVGMIGHTEK